MKKQLLKRWFLLLLLAGIGLAWYCPKRMQPWTAFLDPRVVVALALFLMAWGLESRRFFRSLAQPLPALWATIMSYGAVPLLGRGAGWLLPEVDLQLGLLIIASVPCTLASAVIWTRMAGGNEAIALIAVLLTTGISWLATTAWLSWGSGTAVTVDSAGMMQNLILVLLVPVGLGQLSRASRPLAVAADRHRNMIGVVSRLLIFFIIMRAATDLFNQLGERSIAIELGAVFATVACCLGTHLAALAGGYWSGRLLQFDRPARIAVAFAGSQKTLPVALYLYDAYFKETYPLALLPIVCYHVGQLTVDTFVADGFAKHGAP